MPIIKSLLDTDFYKLTMGHLVFRNYPNVPVKYAFINRTKGIKLAEFISEEKLRFELDQARSLSFHDSEIDFLKGLKINNVKIFSDRYLEFLKGYSLPEYHLEKVDGNYQLEFCGPWAKTIYWETIALPIIAELYTRSQLENDGNGLLDGITLGKARLNKKIAMLKQRPDITFTDFATRRRAYRFWHEYILPKLIAKLPEQFLGTSNVKLSMDHNLMPVGTMAHEVFQVMACMMGKSDQGLLNSQSRVLQDWWKLYGWGLSIVLPDTFGTDFTLRDMTYLQAHSWKGFRHDSGDPLEFGEKIIAFYEEHGVDPKKKLIVFSDGLEIETILKIADHFAGRIQVTFGWGTNLANDIGVDPLSLVIKIVEAAGRPAVKLSDNLAKAVGEFHEIKRYKRVFGYTGKNFQKCKY